MRGFSGRKALIGGLAASALAAGMNPAPAAAGVETQFVGSCSVNGISTFDPPVLAVAQTTSYRLDTLNGTCTGTLDGSRVTGAPVAFFAEGTGSIGCSLADAQGTATLRFTRGTAARVDDATIGLALALQGSLSEWALNLSGLRSGEARARLSYTDTASGNHPHQCVASDPRLGVREIEFLLTATTLSPLASPFVAAEPLHLELRAPRTRRLASLRRHGLGLRVGANAPVAAELSLRLGSRLLAQRSVAIGGAEGGRTSVRLRLSRSSLRALASARRPRLAVAVRATHGSGVSAERTGKVVVKR